jgi:hypothetical protein
MSRYVCSCLFMRYIPYASALRCLSAVHPTQTNELACAIQARDFKSRLHTVEKPKNMNLPPQFRGDILVSESEIKVYRPEYVSWPSTSIATGGQHERLGQVSSLPWFLGFPTYSFYSVMVSHPRC